MGSLPDKSKLWSHEITMRHSSLRILLIPSPVTQRLVVKVDVVDLNYHLDAKRKRVVFLVDVSI